jgi:hypothetical protein
MSKDKLIQVPSMDYILPMDQDFPNPHKSTTLEIPDRFKAYLDGSSNEHKS